MSATRHSTVPISDPAKKEIVDYYRETEDDYDVWSREGYLHYGYWRLGINPFARKRMLEEMNNVVFSKLELQRLEKGRVGDLGCGLGAACGYGARIFPNLEWFGITISPEQVAKGLTLMRATPERSRVFLCSGDYHHLPWESESLECAFFLESLCHSLNPEAALREAVRVLKPAGRLLVVDGYMRLPKEKTPRPARWIERQVAQNWAVPGFHEISRLRSWASSAGLEQIEQCEAGWRVGPSALHCPPLVAMHALKLLLRGKARRRQWQHLVASQMSVVLGLQRRYFGYYLTTFKKA